MKIRLFEKLNTLKSLKPNKHFAGISRHLIVNGHEPEVSDELNTVFSSFRRIQPNPNFALATKLAILDSKKRVSPFAQVANYAFALGLASLFMVVMAGASALFRTSVPLLTDAGAESLVKEAGKVSRDIDIQLQEIDYYALTAKQSTLALNEAYDSDVNHINDSVIQREAGRTNYSNPRNNEVDSMLNEAAY